jgi:hypothetical protein
MSKKKPKTDRELLIEMNVNVTWLKESWERHLRHHSQLYFAGLAIAGSLTVALIVFVMSSNGVT